MKSRKVILLLVCIIPIMLGIASGFVSDNRASAATIYPLGAGTLAEVQSRGTLAYEINGTTIKFCSSDLVALRNELNSLGIWTATQLEGTGTKMTTCENACK